MKKRNILCYSLLLISFCLLFINISDGYIIEKQKEQAISSYYDLGTENKKRDAYLGILEISAIALKRGFYPYSSTKNTVDENIEVITKNCLPSEQCSFILASHSGSSNISFFKHLDKLQLNDEAIIYYQNNQFAYHLERKISVPKNGVITLLKNNKSTLILTTCNKKDDTLQDIYYFH